MKRFSMVMMAGLLLGALASLGLAQAEEKTQQPPAPRIAVKGLDPVDFVAGKAVPGNKSLFVDHNHLRYVFANEKNKATFSKDPARYSIQGDGSCPVIPEAPADPDLVTIYKGRIYSFASLGCMARFSQDPEKFLSKWPGNPDKQKKAG